MTPTARAAREWAIRCSRASGQGHLPSSFSIIELAVSAYAVMRHDPAAPRWPDRDLFILSKGHAALGYYCVLAQLGYFPPAEVEQFGAYRSAFGCHPDRLKVPGVEASCGSLGHGIGIAVGMALALRIQGSDRRVFVLVGDGEANEGSVWEAVMVASDRRLANLTILYDHNRSQVRCLQIPNPAERFAAFGCATTEVDGHDEDAIAAAVREPADTVKVVVGRTIKGYGCASMEQNFFEWHRKSPSPETYEELMSELNAKTV
ncbi:MAG: transketolase [Acidobacteriota bacterium]